MDWRARYDFHRVDMRDFGINPFMAESLVEGFLKIFVTEITMQTNKAQLPAFLPIFAK